MRGYENFTTNPDIRNPKKQRLGTNAVFAVSGKTRTEEMSPDEQRREAMRLRFDLQESAKYLLRNEPCGKRLQDCMVRSVPMYGAGGEYAIPLETIIIERDTKTEKTRYGNLAHCDSPWTCAVCAQRQTEKDKSEVNKAFLSATAKGYIAVMVTYTQRHDRADRLKFLMEVNQDARRWMKSNSRFEGNTWGILKERYGMLGGIINLECTHGESAWHPHNHELIFINPAVAKSTNMDEMYEDFSERWQYAVRQFGGDCDIEHGINIRVGDATVSEYIAKFCHDPHGKWSLESEMTKRATKKAKNGGRTPFQLLYDYRFEGDKQAGALFVEFAQEFSGRAHIRWSQGLRELLEMDTFESPLTDEDKKRQAEEQPEFEPFVAIPFDLWRKFVLGKYGRRAELLIACEQGTIELSELLIRWEYFGVIHWLKKRTPDVD